MFQLRNVALALYAISSILASSLAIHAHVNRYLRKRRYHDTNFSELDEIEQDDSHTEPAHHSQQGKCQQRP